MISLCCSVCHATYAGDDTRWRCDCGGLLDLVAQPSFDLEAIAQRKPTMWRYREAIPLPPAAPIISFDEGFTPLLPIRFGGVDPSRDSGIDLSRGSGIEVWIKQDHLFPTGSYKDRGASVLISQVAALGIERVVEDSSGNAGCAVAAYCARAGVDCAIYVPESTSPAKTAQISGYGARLELVPGNREATSRAVWEAAQHTFYASHVWNPYFLHGTKTFAYEVCEQLGWRAPDTVVLPVGNGTLLLGAAIGFGELRDAGVTQTIPKIVGVQASRCAPLHAALERGALEIASGPWAPTIAEGIAIGAPARARQILEAIVESKGWIETVEDIEVQRAQDAMARQGYYIEPTAAAAPAALERLAPRLAGETIVSVFTGHGLKAGGKH